jgi:hypothetical protein
MAFKKATQRDIGTILTPIGAAGAGATPAAGKVWVLFGVSLCNKSGKATSVNLALREPGNVDTYVLPDFEIPAGETHFPVGALGKQVMLPGDIMVANSSQGGLHAIINFVEVDQ